MLLSTTLISLLLLGNYTNQGKENLFFFLETIHGDRAMI